MRRRWSDMADAERVAYAAECLAKRATDRLKYPLSVMAAAVGTTAEELKRTGDPEYDGRQRKVHQPGVRRVRHPGGDGQQEWEREGASPSEYDARRKEIPEDTRGLTAAVFGDPIPGDMRREKYGNDYTARADRGATLLGNDSGYAGRGGGERHSAMTNLGATSGPGPVGLGAGYYAQWP